MYEGACIYICVHTCHQVILTLMYLPVRHGSLDCREDKYHNDHNYVMFIISVFVIHSTTTYLYRLNY